MREEARGRLQALPMTRTRTRWRTRGPGANVVNFVVEPRNEANVELGFAFLNEPGHIAAQAAYARQATRILPALLPDLADTVAGRALPVSIVRSSHCATKLVPRAQKPWWDFDTQPSIVAGGLRQRWRGADGSAVGDGEFCAFVVVVNLCAAPSLFTVSLDLTANNDARFAKMLAACPSCDVAQHHFNANYNVTLVESKAAVGGGATSSEWELTDIVPAYGSSVLRVGCAGWQEGEVA